jgi:hypothetical protein
MMDVNLFQKPFCFQKRQQGKSTQCFFHMHTEAKQEHHLQKTSEVVTEWAYSERESLKESTYKSEQMKLKLWHYFIGVILDFSY